MTHNEEVLWCDGCGIEIIWVPYRISRDRESVIQDYCCEDCYIGLSCECGERMEMDDERRKSPGITTSY